MSVLVCTYDRIQACDSLNNMLVLDISVKSSKISVKFPNKSVILSKISVTFRNTSVKCLNIIVKCPNTSVKI